MTSRSASQTAWVSGLEPLGETLATPLDVSRLRRVTLALPLRFLVIIANQMREHLGVGVGFEFVAGGEQFLFERVVIFDDAIVNDGDFAGLIEVRMGIFVRGRAVRGPARVADAEISLDRFGFQKARKAFADFAHFLANEQIAATHHSHAGAVIAAIFQPPQSFEQDGRGRLFANVSNDAAHNLKSECRMPKSKTKPSLLDIGSYKFFKIQSAAPDKSSTTTARFNCSDSSRSSFAP